MSSSSFSISAEVAALYRLSPIDFTFLTRVQNTIFTFQRGKEALILRLTPESHRSFEQVMAELEWLRHLETAGVSVTSVVPAENGLVGNRVEVEGTRFTAAAFTKVPGEIGEASYWTPETFQIWGRTMGQMHRAALDYRPTGPRRSDWKQHLPLEARENRDEIEAQTKLRTLMTKLEGLPCPEGAFGLIHSDLHFWNFSMHGRGMTVFDFDNCEYHWFLADLGTVIFEAATCVFQKRLRQEFMVSFLREFLEGYRLEHDFGDALRNLPDFVKLREIQIFLILSKRWKGRELGAFQQQFFSSLRELVLRELPFLEEATMEAVMRG